MCEVVVGLGEVYLVGVEELPGDRLRVTIRSRGPRPDVSPAAAVRIPADRSTVNAVMARSHNGSAEHP